MKSQGKKQKLYIAPFVAAVLHGDGVDDLRAKMICSNHPYRHLPIWGKEFAELLFAADQGVLEGIVRNKICPAFIKKG